MNGFPFTLTEADLGQPLDFANDATFDIVLCPLMMHYLEDWKAVFAGFCRVLKESGMLRLKARCI